MLLAEVSDKMINQAYDGDPTKRDNDNSGIESFVTAEKDTNSATPPQPESFNETDDSTAEDNSQDAHSPQSNDDLDLNKKDATENSNETELALKAGKKAMPDQDLKCLDCSFVCQTAWDLVNHAVATHNFTSKRRNQ